MLERRSNTRFGWRPMTADDLPAVRAAAAEIHQDYPEDAAVFAERLALFPAGCWLATDCRGAVGYAVMHPGRLGRPPCLNSLLGALPAPADCLYLHDIALTAAARGGGLGARALILAAGVADGLGLATLALTSTPAAAGYWRSRGFIDRPGDAELAAHLASYGPGMAYMTRSARPGAGGQAV